MAVAKPVSSFEPQFERLRQLYGDAVPLETVVDVVRSLLDSLRGDISLQHIKVYGELEALARFIEDAKSEISAIRPHDIADEHIPIAHVELGAVGDHLEQATGRILDAAEVIERAGEELQEPLQDQVLGAVTEIYEACNFQDITGQRITKVVSTLQAIEQRIDDLIGVLGDQVPRPQSPAKRAEPDHSDAHLLNGPQVPSNANSQADIDALLASFD